MTRSYKLTDKESLLKIFRFNTPRYFDKKEIKDFKEYLEQEADTYLTIEVDGLIVGGIGYYINGNDNSGSINRLVLRLPSNHRFG